jgi:hypothetical protein
LKTSTLDKLKLALESAKDIIKEAVDTGEVRADNEVINNRNSICEMCEEFINYSRKCRVCGCYMDLKLAFKATKCPINKW